MDSSSASAKTRPLFAPALSVVFASLVAVVVAVHIIAYLIAPIGVSQSGNKSFVYILLYFFLVLGICLIGSAALARRTRDTIERARSAVENLIKPAWLIPALFITASIGAALHLYAKLSVIDLEAMNCLTNLRFLWLGDAGIDRGVVHSLASGLGHILSTFGAVGFFVIFLKRDHLSFKGRWAWITGFVITTFLYVIPIGSRSVLLSFLMTAVLGAVLYGLLNKRRLSATLRSTSAPLAVLGGLFLAYSGYVFMGNMTCQAWVSQDVVREVYLDGYKDELFAADKNPSSDWETNALNNSFLNVHLSRLHGWLRANCVSCAMVAIYLSHGIWNFQHALPYEERPQRALMTFARHWLGRVGIRIGPDDDRPRVYGRGAIALPGAAWYDFGLPGLIGVAILHGIFILAAGFLLPRGGIWSSLGVVTYVCIGLTTLWSLLAFAVNTLSYPFIGLAFLVTFGAVLIGSVRPTDRGAREPG